MNYLEIFGTFIGIIYLWLEYRASIYLWLAGHLYLCLLRRGVVCRLRHQHLLSDSCHLRMVLLDVGTRGKEKSPHYTYPVEMLSATIPCVYRVFRRHRPDTYRIHRQ